MKGLKLFTVFLKKNVKMVKMMKIVTKNVKREPKVGEFAMTTDVYVLVVESPFCISI